MRSREAQKDGSRSEGMAFAGNASNKNDCAGYLRAQPACRHEPQRSARARWQVGPCAAESAVRRCRRPLPRTEAEPGRGNTQGNSQYTSARTHAAQHTGQFAQNAADESDNVHSEPSLAVSTQRQDMMRTERAQRRAVRMSTASQFVGSAAHETQQPRRETISEPTSRAREPRM
jgi:hypothetical protein